MTQEIVCPTVLVVDDELQQRDLAKAVLETLDYQVETAASVKEALDVAQVREQQGLPIDLLMVDNRMPEPKDGIRLIEQLPDFLRTVPIIVRSGDVKEVIGDVVRLRGAGFAIETMQKPSRIEDFTLAIAQVQRLAAKLRERPSNSA